MSRTTSSRNSPDLPKAFGRFCDRFLDLKLEPFQKRIVQDFFDQDTTELLVMLPRGCGKTHLFAALALFHLLTVPRPEVYIAAASRDQARIAFERARDMVQGSRELSKRVTVRRAELRVKGGVLRTLAADAPKVHGLAPTLALVDELHAHGTDALYVALKTALGKRDKAKLATISTAGYDRETILGRLRERALSLPEVKRRGKLTTAHDTAAGFTMIEWSCGESDDLSDPKTVKKANPASFVTEKFLAEQIASPGLHPLEFARYHANVWTDAREYWLEPGAWQKCAADYTIETGERVWVGVDIGGEHAASALVWVTEDLRVGLEVYQGEEAVLLVAERLRALAGELDLAEVAFDPWNFKAPAMELQSEGLPVVPFPQSHTRMVPASEQLYALVTEGKLRHPNDPDLNQHVAKAVARRTARGWRLDKLKSHDQIDAVVALAMAVDRATNKPAEVIVGGWV